MIICSINNCNNIFFCKGYCRSHYGKLKRHGDPLITKRNIDHNTICDIEGCNGKYYSKGFCKKHYIQTYTDKNRKQRNFTHRKWNFKRKIIIINHYTQGKNTCMWRNGCNISDLDMLAVDHIGNNGAEHRRKIGDSATTIIQWLFKHNFPEGFQILCHNHNYKKEAIRRRNNEI